jgi:hypothetical protein
VERIVPRWEDFEVAVAQEAFWRAKTLPTGWGKPDDRFAFPDPVCRRLRVILVLGGCVPFLNAIFRTLVCSKLSVVIAVEE